MNKKECRRAMLAAMRAVPSDAVAAVSRPICDNAVAFVARLAVAHGASTAEAVRAAVGSPPAPDGALQGRRVGLYLALGFEVAMAPAMEALLAAGADVFVPHVLPSGTSLGRMVFVQVTSAADVAESFHRVPPYSLLEIRPEPFAAAVRIGRDAPRGVGGPRAFTTAADCALDALLVPGVAFDKRSGARLGKGGGYYDEFLSAAATVPVAVAFAAQCVALDGTKGGLFPEAAEGVPLEAHDVPVACVVDEAGATPCAHRL